MRASQGLTSLVAAGLGLIGTAFAADPQPAAKAEPKAVKIGIVTFLSGAAAGPFGVPARNGAEVLVEGLNGGKLPAPYEDEPIEIWSQTRQQWQARRAVAAT